MFQNDLVHSDTFPYISTPESQPEHTEGGSTMLVLTRKPGEEIILPDQGVTIRLTEVRGNRALIGVTAPDHIRILRGELRNREPQPTRGEQSPVAAAHP